MSEVPEYKPDQEKVAAINRAEMEPLTAYDEEFLIPHVAEGEDVLIGRGFTDGDFYLRCDFSAFAEKLKVVTPEKLEKLFDAFSPEISSRPTIYSQALIAFDFTIGPSTEVVLAEGNDHEKMDQMLSVLYDSFIPNKVVIFRPIVDKDAKNVISFSPFVENQIARNGQTTVYICENHVCKFPTSDVEKFKELLK